MAMKGKLQLSNSQIDTFETCPQKWYLQKVKRLRPTWTKSSFLFGSAIDDAVSCMLENVGREEKEDYQEAFLNSFNLDSIQINDTVYEGDEALLRVQFSSGDIQTELLDVDHSETIDGFRKQIKAKKALSREQQLEYNDIAYACLLAKGLMMTVELNEWIQENVVEVHAIQKEIRIENDEGDVFKGFLDFVVTLKDGRKILVDLKTTSSMKYYPEGCVENSRQLAIYAQEEGLDIAGYLVVEKNIRKREPKVRVHFIEGEITEEQLDKTFDEIAEATLAIKQGDYPKNEDNCFKFGKCDYYNLCHYGSKKGLEKV